MSAWYSFKDNVGDVAEIWEPSDRQCAREYAAVVYINDEGAGLPPDECDALAEALTQAAARKRAMDAERKVTP